MQIKMFTKAQVDTAEAERLKSQEKAETLKALNEIDLKSIRAMRGATDEDKLMLAELESQAIELRKRMA